MTVPAFLLGRRAALFAAAAGVAILAVLTFAIASVALGALAGSRQDDLEQLAMLQARASEVPLLMRTLQSERLQGNSLASLVPGENEAAAQAALQREIKALVEQNGGEIQSSLVLPSEQTQGLSTIAVQYELSLPITKLRDLTYAIESHVPYFFVSNATLTPPQVWPSDATSAAPRIDIRWTIGAYRWSGTP